MMGVAAGAMAMAATAAEAQTQVDGYTVTAIDVPRGGTGPDATNGFLDSNGTFAVIDVPGAKATYAQAVNNEDEIVGYYEDSSNHFDGFIYEGVDMPGTTWAELLGVNNSGDIVGTYEGSGIGGFVATPADAGPTDPVPLPVMGATIPGVALLLGWMGRHHARRRRAQGARSARYCGSQPGLMADGSNAATEACCHPPKPLGSGPEELVQCWNLVGPGRTPGCPGTAGRSSLA